MDLTVRFAEIPLQGGKLADQTATVRDPASLRQVSISPVALSMMCAAVGRRLRQSEVASIGTALEETMAGEFDSDGISEGDAYAQVFGEVLGPLFTCLERGGDLEIIRLMPPGQRRKQERRADILILDRGRRAVMLQECKGHCSDYYDVEDDPGSLDVCQALRRHRNDGRKQLVWPDAALITDRRVRIVGGATPPQLPVPHGEQSVVTTAVPDGRLRASGIQISPPDHDCLYPCTSCLFDPSPSLVTVLATERLNNTQTLADDGMNFLDWYKSCERAIWGRAHGSFGSALGHLVTTWSQSSRGDNAQAASMQLIAGLAQEAQRQSIFIDTESLSRACPNVDMPRSLESYLHDIHRMQANMPRPTVREGTAAQLGRMLFGHEEDSVEHSEEHSDEAIRGNWLMTLGGEHAGSEGEGTPSEVHIAEALNGVSQATIIPRGQHNGNTVDDLCWGIAEIIAAGRVPTDIIYNGFVEERVVWRNVGREQRSEFRIGKSLQMPWWPDWLWSIDRRILHEMHNCCPYCDDLADMLEHYRRHWPEPFFDYLHWHHYRHRHDRFPGVFHGSPEPLAFVTYDGRAVLNLPSVGS